MHFPAQFFAPATLWLCHALCAALLAQAVWRVRWRQLDPVGLNAWMGACVAVMLFWSLKGGFKPGLEFHLLGGAAFALMAGPWLALIGLAIVLAGVTAYGMAEWAAFGVNFLVMAAAPVAVTGLTLRLAQRLPANYFVYIFFNAFLTGWLSFLCLPARRQRAGAGRRLCAGLSVWRRAELLLFAVLVRGVHHWPDAGDFRGV